ncbi:glycosyl transferase family 9 [Solidesulfovibrio carbinoliphilus subsp. oakridgensis]|uniref:Glycosyl transferase family 9 n=1 Tax=Solidesulfovibrio carbinoliphilus subsp. oakridgensis TaxID=694327 RepID=G7QDK3_9BACT|nr:glycosyltransferase family 9 protein [Solidesulfovibrio carbinoliphilus]EHJ46509.1 glycosyl transferase family 9 [Solidesulfovibrio carbinoliphilus subsp. oakridgensis]
MRIVLQNLTRFGDLLQSQPTLAELAGAGHEVAVACLENFAGAAALLPEASLILPLPGARMLAGLEGNWPEALAAVDGFVDRVVRDFAPEAVVNLTPALAARLLARRLCGEDVLGFSLDPFGFRHESSPWATFLEASSANRGLSPFNVVDLFRKAAGVGNGPGRFALRRPEAAALQAAGERLAAGAPPDAAFFVGFQLGASAAARQWPVAAFGQVGEMLWERYRAVPVLLGGPGETGLAASYRQACPAPAVDLIGATDLPGLAAVLCRLRLLVTNDTGTLHLAAGLDVPSVSIFLATAQPFDTGPYREGCLCLEPDMACHPCAFGVACPIGNACLSAIGPETVSRVVSEFCDTGRFAAGAYPGARAWLSAFDTSGFMDMVSLSGHDAEARAVWLRVLRRVLRQFLDEKPFGEPDSGLPALPPLPGDTRQALATLLGQSAELLRLLEGQAGLAARNQAMKARFLATWERIRGLWTGSPYLGVLGRLWMHEAQQASPDLPALLGRIRRYAACVAALAACLDRS